MFLTVAIFGNATHPKTVEEIRHLLTFMQDHAVNVVLSKELRQELNLREYPCFDDTTDPIDFALSVGGDGTFLTSAAAIGNRNIPILGINCGHLGFLAEVQTRNVDRILKRLIAGKYTIEMRRVLHVTCSEGGHLANEYALNEVAVMKQSMASVINVETHINGAYLHTYRADGLLIATPTGSTAYNMSVGGPLMLPQVKATILSPIAGHSLNVRPLVIPDDQSIDLKIDSRNGNYMVSVDGRSQILSNDVTLHIEQAPYTINLVQLDNHSFLQSLKEKLGWGQTNF